MKLAENFFCENWNDSVSIKKDVARKRLLLAVVRIITETMLRSKNKISMCLLSTATPHVCLFDLLDDIMEVFDFIPDLTSKGIKEIEVSFLLNIAGINWSLILGDDTNHSIVVSLDRSLRTHFFQMFGSPIPEGDEGSELMAGLIDYISETNTIIKSE